MLIFLYGEDTYRCRQKMNEIVGHYKTVHKSGLNLKFFESKNLDFQDFLDEIQTFSMFNEKKLFVLKNVFSNPELKEKFLKKVKKFKELKDIILFYQEGNNFFEAPLFKSLKKEAKSQEFRPLEKEKLKNWAKKEAGRYGKEIDPFALERLINYVGTDLWQLSNEIKKLVNYRKTKRIESGDIEILVRPSIEADIFKTIDALAQKDKKRALYLIYKHLERGDSILYLLTMINFQFRNLLTIKSLLEKQASFADILRKTKLHPFIIKKGYFLAGKFSLKELEKIYRKIFQVDLDIKTGRMDPETALDLLIAEI